MSTHLEGEEISTLAAPLPLPPYESDPLLSEDENLLIWVSILARHSSSKKGHMGTIFVLPPKAGQPSNAATACSPPLSSRIIAYANNTPLLYAKQDKAVPEIHAEALAISRSAARGVSLAGCTVYISFPPCNECFKLLVAAGVKRCVFKKGIPAGDGQGDAVLVAAEAHGIEMVGTLDTVNLARQRADREMETRERQAERKQEEVRDGRVRKFWAEQGEDATKTRRRVSRWWEDWMQRYKEAEKRMYTRLEVRKHKGGANGASTDIQNDDLDELVNEAMQRPPPLIPAKRASKEAQIVQNLL